jgi:hypothetical protein
MSPIYQIHAQPNERLPQSFEGMAEALSHLPGMVFEMDGSFVWMDHHSKPPGQMDGFVYDRDGRIEYVDVKGAFNGRQWRELCCVLCRSEICFDSDRDFSSVATILRVHRTDLGEWTTASAVATLVESQD